MRGILYGLVGAVLAAGAAFAEAYVYDYAGSQGEDVRILVLPTAMIFNPGTGDAMVADFEKGDITVAGPGGGPMSMRDVMKQFGAAGSAAGAAPSTGSVEGDIEAMLAGIPEELKPMIKQQLAAVPAEQRPLILKTLRGSLGLSDMAGSLQAMPKQAAAEIADTGRTRTEGGIALREVIIDGDRVWVADAASIEKGQDLADGFTKFTALFEEISQGAPVPGSSILYMGKLDGEVPFQVMAADGEEFRYEGTSLMSLPEAQVFMVPN